MKNYTLSIIIPTKNRQKYCLAAINQILTLGIENVEICIQDNSDNNSLEESVAALSNGNIAYNYYSGELSFVDNFSMAVGLAHGEYLCMIGDDDGILPNIKDIVLLAKEKRIDSVIPSLGCVYYWPSDNPIIDGGETGVLCISHRKREGTRITDSNKALHQLLNNAVQDYTSLDIPRLYHGIVRKDCIDRIKEITGTYFDGLTPDMYMATALCFVCQKTLRIDYPITISGICPTSGSSDSATGKHTGRLNDAPHFRGHSGYEWDTRIPAFYSVDTIWAETLMQALTKFHREDLKSEFNLPLFEMICLKKFPEFAELIKVHAKENGVSTLSMKFQHALFSLQKLQKIIYNRMNPKKKIKYLNVDDIQAASERMISQVDL